MSDDDYDYTFEEAERRADDAAEAQRRKAKVGMAEPGTAQYYRNAKYILQAYTHPNATTSQKLSDLEDMGY